MVFFRNQFANVVEWEEFRDDMIFWKWSNRGDKERQQINYSRWVKMLFLSTTEKSKAFLKMKANIISNRILSLFCPP